MSTVVINPDFSELLKQPKQKQNEYFAGYKDQFKTVPIVSGDENVELGDHICVHRALFTHHFICTGCNDDKIVLRTARISQSKKPCKQQSLEVKDREYTYQQLEEKHVSTQHTVPSRRPLIRLVRFCSFLYLARLRLYGINFKLEDPL